MMNKLMIEGRLTNDPKMNDKGNLVFITLAQNTGYKDKRGKDITNFVTMKAFSKLAEVIGDYCLKGDLISCECHVTTEQVNGDYKTAVVVDNMHFLSKVQKQEEKKDHSRNRR